MRALVIGAGLMGRWHADAIRRVGGAVVAVVDANVPRAIVLARSIGGGCAPVGSLEDAFARHRPEVVHVCTPSGTHEPLVEQSLVAGCHVLVEKPLAATAAETERLLVLAAERRRLLCPVHQFLFQRGAAHVIDLAQRGLLGDIVHVDATACSSGADGMADPERDTIALDIAPHALALGARLAPGALQAMRWTVARPRAGELRVLGEAEGLSIGITISMRARPTRNGATIFGTRGSAELDLFHGFATVHPPHADRRWKITRPFVVGGAMMGAAGVNLARRALSRETAYPGLRELVRRFHEGAAGGGVAPISARESLAVATARDRIAALRSAAERGSDRDPATPFPVAAAAPRAD